MKPEDSLQPDPNKVGSQMPIVDGKPSVGLPGSNHPTPGHEAPSVVQQGSRPPAPAGWYDPVRIIAEIMEIFETDGPAAAQDLQGWINARKQK